jgi:alkanesulfonate monooxygenase SsuD/methylene tetrahydromethanopterin reductase-like flavin-dependent oxidoreductase (luciferase family)
MARQVEALGFDHVTANDHIVVPNRIASRYPCTAPGEWPGARAGECLEQVTVLGFLPAATSRIRFVTSVMVVRGGASLHQAMSRFARRRSAQGKECDR